MLFIALLLFVAGVAALSLRNKSAQRSSPSELRIGAIYPLTGPAASLGTEFRNGVALAVENANQTGRAVKLQVEDGKAVPATSVAAMRKLIGEKVDVVMTTISGVSLAVKPIAIDAQVLLFADAAHPSITLDGQPYVFRHNQTASQEAEVIFEFLQSKSIGRIAMLISNDEYSKSVQSSLLTTSRGSEFALDFVIQEQFDPATLDLKPSVEKVMASKPDAVVLSGVGKPLGSAILQLRSLGFGGLIVSTMGFSITPDAKTAAGVAADGVWYTRFQIDTESEAYRAFAAMYEKRFGNAPNDFAVLSFNTANLVIDSYFGETRLPESSKVLSERIHGLGNYRGAGERMSIKPNGDILPEVGIVGHKAE